MKNGVSEPAQESIQVVTRGVGLEDSGIEALHGESEVDGVEIVEGVTAEEKAGNGHGGRQRQQIREITPEGHAEWCQQLEGHSGSWKSMTEVMFTMTYLPGKHGESNACQNLLDNRRMFSYQ